MYTKAKQLVDSNGKPLIARTVNQVRTMFPTEPHIITRDPGIAGHGIDSCYPVADGWLVETLYHTIQL